MSEFDAWAQIHQVDKKTVQSIKEIVRLMSRKKLTQRQAGVVLEGVRVLLMESPV